MTRSTRKWFRRFTFAVCSPNWQLIVSRLQWESNRLEVASKAAANLRDFNVITLASIGPTTRHCAVGHAEEFARVEFLLEWHRPLPPLADSQHFLQKRRFQCDAIHIFLKSPLAKLPRGRCSDAVSRCRSPHAIPEFTDPIAPIDSMYPTSSKQLSLVVHDNEAPLLIGFPGTRTAFDPCDHIIS